MARSTMRLALLAGSMMATASVAVAAPTNYGLLTTVGIPTTAANVQPGGAFTSFDISYVDGLTGFFFSLTDPTRAWTSSTARPTR